MGRLAGFRYREIVRKLKALGFQFDRQAGSHEILVQRDVQSIHDGSQSPGDMPEGTLRAILRQADVDPNVFLQA